jgi:uncharacterized protein with GYD domain
MARDGQRTKEQLMPKYAILFTLKGETVKGMIDRPSDRERVVSNLLSGVGGALEAYYWMFGQWDGIAICDVPDSTSAAAVSVAVSSTGAFGHLETHELIPAGSLNEVLDKAKNLSYFPPGG